MTNDAELAREKARQRGMNPVTLERLKESGIDLSVPLQIVNVFYIFEANDAARLTARLEELAFRITSPADRMVDNGGEFWKIDAVKELQPNVANLDEMTDKCSEAAGEFDAEYDGWFTEV